MSITPAQLGFLRAIGVAFVLFLLTYLGDASHLNGILSAGTATVVAGLALALEHYIEDNTGKALFGTTSIR